MTDRADETPRGRTLLDGPAAPVVVAPGTLPLGRASGLALREEGPAKLTGEALYADDLVFPEPGGSVLVIVAGLGSRESRHDRQASGTYDKAQAAAAYNREDFPRAARKISQPRQVT